MFLNSDLSTQVTLRPATSEDFAMALNLYLETMKPLTSELMVWDDAKQRAAFADQWEIKDVRIVVFEDDDVGWMQASETDSEIFLRQLFVEPAYQRKGIGSAVLSILLGRSSKAGKPIVLTVLKNNPARSLYERFGFKVVGEAGAKLHMSFDPS